MSLIIRCFSEVFLSFRQLYLPNWKKRMLHGRTTRQALRRRTISNFSRLVDVGWTRIRNHGERVTRS